MRSVLAVFIFCLSLSACAPGHLRPLGLSGERDVGEVFLGGWDGRRLRVFNDLTVEPGVTPRKVLVQALSNLSGSRFAALWVDGAQLDAELRAHDGFCETAMCVFVFERQRGRDLPSWGPVVAVFELVGDESQLVGSAWLANDAIRPPGPESWSLRCRDENDRPVAVHADGGAIYPHRIGEVLGTRYALFDRERVPETYRKPAMLIGFQAPNASTCDHDKARLSELPEPEKPRIDIDSSLLGQPAP